MKSLDKRNPEHIITSGHLWHLQYFSATYVGYGYRLMHGSLLDLMNKVDGVLFLKRDRGGKYF